MRIIAGSKARFKLIPPKDRTTRPITDRVKESLFSILYPYLEGAIVADIFCGTGSLGLEAVSRGARHAILVDQDFDAINRLKQNISHLQFYEQTTIRKLDAYRFGIPRMEHIPRPVDLVFIDPPFAHLRDTSEHSRLAKLMRKLAAQVADEALAVIRHEARVILPESFTGWQQSDRRDYGSMAITFYTQIPQLKSIEEPQDEEPRPL